MAQTSQLPNFPNFLLGGGVVEVCDKDPAGFPDRLGFSWYFLGLAFWLWRRFLGVFPDLAFPS